MSDNNDILPFSSGFSSLSVRQQWTVMARALVECLDDYTANASFAFSGTFAKLDHTLRQLHLTSVTLRRDLNALRDFNRHPRHYDDNQLQQRFPSVFASLTTLLQTIQKPPKRPKKTNENEQPHQPASAEADTLRVVVLEVENDTLLCAIDDDFGSRARVTLTTSADHDFTYLLPYVNECLLNDEPCQLNLIHPHVDNERTLFLDTTEDDATPTYVCELIVFQPDYLIDITSVAKCFQAYGVSPLNWLVSLFDTSERSQAILLGDFAGQLLDEAIYHQSDPLSYSDSVLRFFRHHAIALATCPNFDSDAFHAEAKRQQRHLRQLVNGTLPKSILDFQEDKVVLEPSFICETLGVQGRMDLMQDDMTLLIEQKSGKMDEFHHRHKEDHYVQMLLYLAVLHYGYNIRNDSVTPFLLYSKYDLAEGLLREGPAPALLRQAMEMRNGIAHLAFNIGRGNGERLLSDLRPNDLRLLPCTDNLWIPYVLPRLNNVLTSLQTSDEITRRYFFRFLTFLQREQTYAKLGNGNKQNSGFAATWHDSPDEKIAAGNIIASLTLKDAEEDQEGEGISTLRFQVNDQPDLYAIPNFRKGDYAMLYSYEETDTPDARHSIVFQANILELSSDEIRLRLPFPQKNHRLFTNPHHRFAIEHAHRDGIGTSLFRSLHRLFTTDSRRRDLLLCQETPTCSDVAPLHADYGDAELNDIIRKAMSADDFFLLVGPPGTGKTSKGLLSIVQENLALADTSVLLMAYTNRAVDEICAKLVAARIDFLRLGNALTCATDYHSYLLQQRAESCKSIDEIKRMILSCRVMVATTSTMLSNSDLFNLRSFSTAIIDEASQILEPQLIGLLCASAPSGSPAIRKFILIGDHKQLPAVVRQSAEDAIVKDELLRSIGLNDCRQSLFQRLYNRYATSRPELVATLTRQARMHEEVAAFPAMAFYGNQLHTRFPRQSLPLQGGEHPFVSSTCDWLLARRFAFVHIAAGQEIPSLDKVNVREARFIAHLITAIPEGQTIGVIVPYRHQIAAIHRELASLNWNDEKKDSLIIDTVERFQGSERDIILFGATVQRARQLRFLASDTFLEGDALIDRRLNVALTRARERMFVIGNATLLQKLPTYAALIDHAKKSHAYVEVKR